ncbi:MAG: glycerol-3-phosphate 1-O-acyltransferase PlsY [Herpetosiphon sp.]
MTAVAAIVFVSYLVGSIPFALLVARFAGGVDIRQIGSGNTGALNTIMNVGPVPGVIAGLMDAAKGAVMMLLAAVLVGKAAAALAGGAAIVGHCYSIWLMLAARNERGGGWKRWLRRFGGKGLATGMAVLLIINWPTFLTTMLLFFALYGLLYLSPLPLEKRKDVTYPTVGALLVVPFVMWYWTHALAPTSAALLLAVAIIVKHLPDLRTSYYVAGPAKAKSHPET